MPHPVAIVFLVAALCAAVLGGAILCGVALWLAGVIELGIFYVAGRS